MSEWLKETGCKPVGYAYAGSNPAPPTASPPVGGRTFRPRSSVRMSEQQQVQERDPIVKPCDIARYLRRDCRGLRDSLQLEMAAAQYYLQLRGVMSPHGVPVGDAATAGVIADLEAHGDDLSHA